MPLDVEFNVALQAATEAAKIQMNDRWTRSFTVDRKPDQSLITSTDRACDAAIVGLLRERFPDDGVLSEESGHVAQGSSGRTWVVDPLDGTRYFALGFEAFGPFIALQDKDGTLLGLVLQSTTGTLWWARRGMGAYMRNPLLLDARDQRLLTTSGRPVPTLADTMAAIGYPRKLLGGRISLDQLLPRFGSTLNVAPFRGFTAVAEGTLDVYIASGIKEWDLAANKIIVCEAGGAVIPLERTNGMHYVAARTQALAAEAMAAINECAISNGTDS